MGGAPAPDAHSAPPGNDSAGGSEYHAPAGYQVNPPYHPVHGYEEQCSSIYIYYGALWEQETARGFQWFAVFLSALFLAFYGWHAYKASVGWEEVYVCSVELIKVILEIYFEFTSPAMLFLYGGNITPWLRYAEWLLTCPVILIHLSNITGLSEEYNKRTMALLVSDLGTICMGVTAALATGWVKWLFYCIGLVYGTQTFYNAGIIYVESYYIMPAGGCKKLVLAMTAVYYSSWLMFPGLFIFGPEGMHTLSVAGSTIGHTIADLLSKNIWGLLGHFLRIKIHEHIIMYGDIRRPVSSQFLGRKVDVLAFVTEEDKV
nr:SdChR [synthetic construct]